MTPMRLARAARCLLLVAFLTASLASRAETPPKRTLAEIAASAAEQATAAEKARDSAQQLVRKLSVSPTGFAADPDGIRLFGAGASALAAAPLGGTGGLYVRISAALAPQSPLRVQLAALKEALKDAEGKRAPLKQQQEAVSKTRAEALQQLAQLGTRGEQARGSLQPLLERLAGADKTLASAAADLQAATPGYEDAVKLQARMETLLKELAGLHTGEGGGALQKAVRDFFTAGNRLSAELDRRLTATGLPALTADPTKAGLADIQAAMAGQLSAFAAAEALQRRFAAAIEPLQGKSGTESGPRGLRDGLLPDGFTAEKSAGDSLCNAAVERSERTRGCVTGFPHLVARLRDEAGRLAEAGSQEYSTTRQALKQCCAAGEHNDPCLHLPKQYQVVNPGNALFADLGRADEGWPLLAAQLKEVQEYQAAVQAGNTAFQSMRPQRELLGRVVSLLEETLAGDTGRFVSEQVRLFYFTNVPRLMQTLNSKMRILNPDGAAAVEDARRRQKELAEAEQELHEVLAQLAGTKRSLVVRREEIAEQEGIVAKARSEKAQLEGTLSELKKALTGAGLDKGQKDAALAKKQADLKAAEAAGDAAEVARLTAEVAAAQEAAANAAAQQEKAQKDVDNQQALVTPAGNALTAAETELTALRGTEKKEEGSEKALSARAVELSRDLAVRRQKLFGMAAEEAAAFGEAIDRTPIYFAPADRCSSDPVHRVMMYAYADSKTLFIRGLPEDVEKVLEVIAGFDRPAPQARVTLWTLQLNGRKPQKINERLHVMNEALAYLRNDVNSLQDVLRNSVTKEVNSVAQGMRELERGTPLELDERLNRYFYYPREIRERLGFRPAYTPWWIAAQVILRLEADLRSIDATLESIASLTARIEAKDANEKELREQRRLLDEFLAAAYRDAKESLGRVEVWTKELEALRGCVAGGVLPDLQSPVDRLRSITQRIDSESGMANGPGARELITSQSDQDQRFKSKLPEDSQGPYRAAVAEAVKQVQALKDGLRSIAKSLITNAELDASPVKSRGSLGLHLKDLDYVTRWTIPDPVHCTTLGETMFVLSLGRRSCRLAVLRDFTNELIKLRQRAAQEHTNEGGKAVKAARGRREQYGRFLEDNLAVLRSLMGGDGGMIAPSPLPGGKREQGAINNSMPAFPALPKILFGAINGPTTRLTDDELTANQLEILLAVQTKARSAVAREICYRLRQLDRTRDLTNEAIPNQAGADEFREQYLPLFGWLIQSYVDSPRDFAETAGGTPRPCRIPPSYRELGAHTARLMLDDTTGRLSGDLIEADMRAWVIANAERKAYSLAQATARVAAADDMIKRLMIITEDDVDYYFVGPTLRTIQEIVQSKRSPVESAGISLSRSLGLSGLSDHPVNLGIIQRTSVLATNRLVARVSPNANGDVTIDGPEDFLLQAQQLGQLAQGVNNSFFAPQRASRGIGSGVAAAGAAKAAGVASSATLGVIGGAMGLLSLLEEQKQPPPGEVYAINSGDMFKVTPIFDPSGQALRFKFDYAATARVREPDGTVNPSIPRIERHTVNTEVQLSNLEVREISRFGVNTRLGVPERRTGGIPFVRELPLLRDLPILGYFTRQAGTGGLVQESVILGQTAIYPTVGEIVDLLVDVPQRADVGDQAPAYLRDAKQTRAPMTAPRPPAGASTSR